MFAGTHTPKLDDKGRLFLPADFAEFSDRLRDSTDPRRRAYNRMLFALLSEQVPDKQGRITLTPELRDYAGLERDCVVIGVRNKLEVWKPEVWAEYTQAQEEAFANLSEELFLD